MHWIAGTEGLKSSNLKPLCQSETRNGKRYGARAEKI